MPKKPCSHPACRTLLPITEGSRCEKHRTPSKSTHKPSYSRDQDTVRFYNSSQWRKLSKRFLSQNPLCKHCLERGFITPADHTDHVVELSDDWDKRLNWENLQSLCHACHNRKTWEEKKKRNQSKQEIDLLEQIRCRSSGKTE